MEEFDTARITLEELKQKIEAGLDAEEALWQTVVAWQNCPFYTYSGLPFSYTVKRKRDGQYSGELLISRKEGSKTLTKSSVMLAFRTILEQMNQDGKNRNPPFYSGPKSIGKIFGISYVYSLFWKWGLIRVPDKVEQKLLGLSGSIEEWNIPIETFYKKLATKENGCQTQEKVIQ